MGGGGLPSPRQGHQRRPGGQQQQPGVEEHQHGGLTIARRGHGSWPAGECHLLEPARLTDVLLMQAPHTGIHDCRAAKVADQLVRRAAVDDGQAPHITTEHLRDRVVKELIRIGHDRLLITSFQDRPVLGAFLCQRTDNIAPGDDADQAASVDDRESLMPHVCLIAAGNVARKVRYFHGGGDGRQPLIHHIRHMHLLKDIRLVFKMDVDPAPSQFLGHDRVPHQHKSDPIGDHTNQHQGEDGIVVAGELEGEDNEREGGA